MAYIVTILFVVSGTLLVSIYFGIWGSLLDAFSDARIRDDLLMASRLSQYDQARIPSQPDPTLSSLSFFKQADKLSQRQREIFKEILDETNRKLIFKLLVLFFLIAWGTIYLSHKIAGPLYRFHAALTELRNGNLRIRIQLRQGDEAKFVEKRFNEAAGNLDSVFSRIKRLVGDSTSERLPMRQQLQEELSKIKTSADL